MKFEVTAEGRRYVWNLTEEFRKLLDPIAAEFGWTPEEFLTRHSAGMNQVGSSLPGQFPKVPDKDDEPEMYEEFSAAEFAYDESLWLRIRNVAKMNEQTPREFIWRLIWGAVCDSESEMIVSPRNGRFLFSRGEFSQFLLSNGTEEGEEQ